MKKILSFLLIVLSVFLLSSCDVIFVFQTDETQKTFNTIDFNQITDDGSKVIVTTTTETPSSATTTNQSGQATTTNNQSYSSTSYTYYDIGQEATYYNWKYINSIGDQKILVIPVKISEYASLATSSLLTDIEKTFFGKSSDTYWESVTSFYYKSSYGKLNFSGEVVKDYMGPFTVDELTSTKTKDGIDTVLNATDSYLTKNNINPKDYDSNNDGYIDLVWYVYAAPYATDSNELSDDFWAFTSSPDAEDIPPSTTRPKVNNYCWASYDFMYEAKTYMFGVTGLDAHTYIHETGHALGLDDYYDADDENGNDPVENVAMMSANVTDHDSFSKFALGWVTPTEVTGNCTIVLRPFSEYGDCCIIGLNYDGNAFSEYIIFEYYTPTGLNEKDAKNGYSNSFSAIPTVSGIRIFHVDARPCYENNRGKGVVVSNLTELKNQGKELSFLAYSNSESYAICTPKSTKLISIIDRSQGDLSTFSKTLKQNSLYVAGNTFLTSSVNWHSGTLSKNYSVTFKNTSNGIELTFSVI